MALIEEATTSMFDGGLLEGVWYALAGARRITCFASLAGQGSMNVARRERHN